jgi:hypothetical protein
LLFSAAFKKGEASNTVGSLLKGDETMSEAINVRDLSLKSQGGYTCDMYVRFKNPGKKDWEEKHTAKLSLGETHTSDPGKHGAVDGAQLGIAIDIEWGKHVNDDSGNLIYMSESNARGEFACSGTTLSPSLGYTGVHE